MNKIIIIVIIVIIIFIFSIFFLKKANPHKCQSYVNNFLSDKLKEYPNLNLNYKLDLNKFVKNSKAECIDKYKKSENCDDLKGCIGFIPYYCAEGGRRHFATTACKDQPTDELKQNCINDQLSQVYVWGLLGDKTINCNDININSPFPLSS